MAVRTNHRGYSRRDCLQIGLSTLLGGGLATALRAQAHDGTKPQPIAKSCILIWMDGGPTHYETFDPKPGAPSEIRGEFSPLRTKVPGIMVSEHMKKLARLMDKIALVRSIRHDQGNHGAGNHYMMTGAPPRIPVGCGAFVSFHPSLGSVVAQEVGAPAGLPAYFSMPSMSRSGGPNFLGAQYAPFVVDGDPNNKNFRVRDVTIPAELTTDRFTERCDLRKDVDQFQRLLDNNLADPALGLDEHYRQASKLMQSKQAQAAFDISNEPDVVREAYGRNGFGQRALLARRLVEAGVPFITLYDGGWDHHAKLFESLKKRLPTWDQTVAALIHDLDQRGLLDSTLVIALGEFGRTPKINKDSGRDHWSNAMSVMFAGGKTPGGQVIGATDRQGYAAVERVLSPENFTSTVYTKLGIDPGKILYAPNGRPSHLVSDPTPIKELMG
jgi:acetyl esterase/lipase